MRFIEPDESARERSVREQDERAEREIATGRGGGRVNESDRTRAVNAMARAVSGAWDYETVTGRELRLTDASVALDALLSLRTEDGTPLVFTADQLAEMRLALAVVSSWAIAGPTNEASERARDAAVEHARRLSTVPESTGETESAMDRIKDGRGPGYVRLPESTPPETGERA